MDYSNISCLTHYMYLLNMKWIYRIQQISGSIYSDNRVFFQSSPMQYLFLLNTYLMCIVDMYTASCLMWKACMEANDIDMASDNFPQ